MCIRDRFQTIAVCLVHLASLCFQLHSRPFRDSYEKISLENSAETMVLLTLHFSFMNVRYAFLTPHASAPIVWLLVVVNAIVICSLVVCIILLLGRAHILPAPPQTPTQHDPEDAPDRPQSTYRNRFLSPLISDRKGNQYGTLHDAWIFLICVFVNNFIRYWLMSTQCISTWIKKIKCS